MKRISMTQVIISILAMLIIIQTLFIWYFDGWVAAIPSIIYFVSLIITLYFIVRMLDKAQRELNEREL